MKRIAFSLSLIALIITSCNNETKTESTATDTSAAATTTPEAPPMDSAAMAKAWQDFATPGDMHKWLAGHVGTWEADVSSYAGGPEPSKSKANKMDAIIDGKKTVHFGQKILVVK